MVLVARFVDQLVYYLPKYHKNQQMGVQYELA